jgi:hypothetical protein
MAISCRTRRLHTTLSIRGSTYEDRVSNRELKRIGKKKWSKRVRQVIEQLEPILNYDILYIGGGNAKKLIGDRHQRSAYSQMLKEWRAAFGSGTTTFNSPLPHSPRRAAGPHDYPLTRTHTNPHPVKISQSTLDLHLRQNLLQLLWNSSPSSEAASGPRTREAASGIYFFTEFTALSGPRTLLAAFLPPVSHHPAAEHAIDLHQSR